MSAQTQEASYSISYHIIPVSDGFGVVYAKDNTPVWRHIFDTRKAALDTLYEATQEQLKGGSYVVTCRWPDEGNGIPMAIWKIDACAGREG